MKKKFIVSIFLLIAPVICDAGEEQIKLNNALSSFRGKYSLAPSHRAFAQSEEGAWAWSADKPSVQDAIDDAIVKCTKNLSNAGDRCITIHVDDKWIPRPPLDKQKVASDILAKKNNAEQVGVLTLADGNIKEFIETSKGRLVVQFTSYDPGCGYCDISNSPFEKLVPDYVGVVRFARITWEPWKSMNQEIINYYHLYGLPALIVFNDGKEEFRILGWGASQEKEIRNKLDVCCKH